MRSQNVVIERRSAAAEETDITPFHLIDETGHTIAPRRRLGDVSGSFSTQSRRFPVGPFQIDGFKEGL